MTPAQPPQPDPNLDPDSPGYEASDASVPGLLTFAAGLIIAGVVIQLALLGIYRVFVRERPDPVKLEAQENLYQQLRTLRHDEEATLGGYGWVDREAGVVRIPIGRAIALTAAKGIAFGKGPKTEIEMNSHAGGPVPADGKDAPTPPADPGSKK